MREFSKLQGSFLIFIHTFGGAITKKSRKNARALFQLLRVRLSAANRQMKRQKGKAILNSRSRKTHIFPAKQQVFISNDFIHNFTCHGLI